jgi:hypothetical protein
MLAICIERIRDSFFICYHSEIPPFRAVSQGEQSGKSGRLPRGLHRTGIEFTDFNEIFAYLKSRRVLPTFSYYMEERGKIIVIT